jgi:hypothetical protein
MKKLLLVVAALSAMFVVSCNESEFDVNDPKHLSEVTIYVETPEIVSRAYGDGTSATDLYYGIYDAQGNLVSAISKIDDSSKEEINISKTLNLNLVTGNTYSMILWADNADDVCDVDFANKVMTFNPVKANLEAYDAFYAYEAPFKVEGNMSKTIKLYRPFAQVNVGTNDVELAKDAGLELVNSQIKVKTYSKMDLVTGNVSEEVDCTYAYNAIPQGETFPVAGYDYISMNYLLVAADKATVDIEFSYNNGGNYVFDYTFVPVQRNYRTNIYGSILTSDVEVKVVIEPTFNDPDYNYPVTE